MSSEDVSDPSEEDVQRFEALLVFRNDGASMSEAQWQEHLKAEPLLAAWLKARDAGA